MFLERRRICGVLMSTQHKSKSQDDMLPLRHGHVYSHDIVICPLAIGTCDRYSLALDPHHPRHSLHSDSYPT